jgi:RNA polymerase sigma-70 factor, ECF subfamily
MATGLEQDLLDRLRAGDEDAFARLVERYHRQLIRIASAFVANGETAEEVAQETWLALLTGIDRFEARSSLRTWLFQICVNRARSIGEREHRTVPVALIEPALDAEQVTPSGAWTSPAARGSDASARASSDAELVAVIRMSIRDLPAMQRSVVTMRDVDGLTGKQVCQELSISEANQRVLLHRGRSSIRHSVAAILPTQRRLDHSSRDVASRRAGGRLATTRG